MKRTFPANIDGQIFYIDEDAYLMLQDYLLQLKNTFYGIEGDEIVSDIESRIRELFSERIASGAAVIVRADVASVIETMGRPEQISGQENVRDETQPDDPQQAPKDESKPFVEFNLPKRKRLYRNMKNKVFGGVLGGLAAYLDWNANILRLFFAVLTVAGFSWGIGFALILVYLIAWMIIPPADTPAKILEMRGEPVNVDTVGQEFMASSPAAAGSEQREDSAGFFSTIFSVIGKVILGFFGLIALLTLFGGLVVFMTVLICQLGIGLGIETLPFENLPWEGAGIIAAMILVWSIVGVIAASALVWTAACALFNARPASRTLKITALIMEIVLISFGITLSLMVAGM